MSSSLDPLSKLSKRKSPQKLFRYDCVTVYVNKNESSIGAVGDKCTNFKEAWNGNWHVSVMVVL